ncbi:MAG TPA: hypothetical protein VNA14_11625 [Mycobacteriales bacterium]|nr:hypothetical protein [Mycobacteriales bacterium]
MASNAQVIRQVAELLMRRPEVRRRGRRPRRDDIGLSTRPNAPRFVTIVVAVLLTLVGLAVTRTVEIQPILDLLAQADLELTQEQGWLALAASPALLVAGSFLRGL